MKKYNILWVTLLGLGLILAACGGQVEETATSTTDAASALSAGVPTTESQPAAATAEEAPAEPVEMRFLSGQNEDEGFTKIIGDLSKACEASVNMTYVYENVPADADMNQRLQLLASSGSLPVLFNLPTNQVAYELYQNGLIVDIEQVFTDAGVADELVPAAVSYLKSPVTSGVMLGTPTELNVEGFWYNKQIFADNGLEVPTTWDELMQAAETIQASGIQPFAASGEQRWPLTRLIGGYALRYYGPDALERVNNGELKFTDEGFVEAAQVLYDMGENGWFGLGVNEIDYLTAVELFLQGKAAMFYMGSWELRDYNNPEMNQIGAENVGLFNIPLVEGGAGTLDEWGVNTGLVSGISKAQYDANPEVIQEWIQCVFSEYGDRAMSDLSMVTGFRVDNPPAELPELTQMVIDTIEGVGTGTVHWEYFFGAQATEVSWSNVQLLVTGQMTAEEYMAELQTAVDAEKAGQ